MATAIRSKNKTDIDSYLGILYGAYKGNGWYCLGPAGYAWHDYYDRALPDRSGRRYGDGRPLRQPVLGLRRDRRTAALHGRRADAGRLAHLEPARSKRLHGSEHGGMGLTIASQENTSLSSGLGAKALIPHRRRHAAGRPRHLVPRVRRYQSAGDGGVRRRLGLQRCGPGVGRDTAAVGVGLFAYAADRRQLPAQLRRAAAAGLHRPHRLGTPEGRVLRR